MIVLEPVIKAVASAVALVLSMLMIFFLMVLVSKALLYMLPAGIAVIVLGMALVFLVLFSFLFYEAYKK